jgi:ATP synthase protein I
MLNQALRGNAAIGRKMQFCNSFYPVFMKRETRRTFKEMAYYSSLGLSVSFAVFIGLGIGVVLDRKLDTSPWFTLIFLGFGIVAGFRNIGRAIKRVRKL